MKRFAMLTALAATTPGIALGESDSDAQARVLYWTIDAMHVDAPAGDPANSCGSAPLPLTPVGPVVNGTLRWGTDSVVNVQAWRYPCSAADSMIVLTLAPTDISNPSFICSAAFTLLQSGGLQTDALSARTDPGTINSFCQDLIAQVTLGIVPTSQTPLSFDFDQATTIDFDGSSAGHQTIAIAAYNPANYNLTPPPGPDAVRVFLPGGTGRSYQNCTVTIQPSGAGDLYRATCAGEAPLQANGFDRYPN